MMIEIGICLLAVIFNLFTVRKLTMNYLPKSN